MTVTRATLLQALGVVLLGEMGDRIWTERTRSLARLSLSPSLQHYWDYFLRMECGDQLLQCLW